MTRFCWILVFTAAAGAQSWKCDSPQAKLYSKRLIAVRCSQPWPEGTAQASVTTLPDRTIVEDKIAVQRLPGTQSSRIHLLPIHLQQDITPDNNYEITVANGADKSVVSLTLDKASLVNQLGIANRGKIFLVQSAVRLARPIGPAFLTEVRQPELYDTLTGKPVPEVIVRHPADLEVRETVPSDDPAHIDFALAGLAIVKTTDATWIRGKEVTLRIDGIHDIFGRELPTTTKVKLDPAPKGKDDANVYLMLSHTAEKLKKPSFALDAKYATPFARRGQWYISPDMAADVGNDQADAKNTIQGGLAFNRTFVARVPVIQRTCAEKAKTGQPSSLEANVLSPAILYETDRDGAKKNLLPSFDWQPIFSGLHNSIDEQTARWAAQTCKDPDKIVPPKFGWGIDAKLGAEGGGSLAEQTAENTDKSQTLTAKRYAIFRPRPVITAFFETRWFSVVDTVTLRYLFTTEHIIDTDAFALNDVSGFHPYNDLTISVPIGRTKNVAIAVQYEWGEKPPLYKHLNTVTSGITFKY